MIYTFYDFEFDDERLRLRHGGQVVKTGALVGRLLAALLRRTGELVTKAQLIEHVWEGRVVADNVLTVAMARLRKTLRPKRGESEHILTVYGRGYRFVTPVMTREHPDPHPFISVGVPERSPCPFVGRDRVLERLEHALADARLGRGGMCVLAGEPGIGKTRTVEALEQRLASTQVRVAWSLCCDAGDTPPLSPWMRLLREVAPSYVSGSHLESSLAPWQAELRSLLRPAEGTATPQLLTTQLRFDLSKRHEFFELFVRVLTRCVSEKPWVLVLDDLHCADAASLELLSYLMEEISHSRILIVATLRHRSGQRVPRPETHLPYVLGHRNCERIALNGLRETDVAAYVQSLFEDDDGTMARAIYAKSEGHPFFMTELSRQLRDENTLGLAEIAVPDAALHLVRQSLSKLEADARDVLAAAAVIGRTFELRLLRLITGLDWRTVMRSIDAAVEANVVVAAPDSNTTFSFAHDLLRAVLYDGLAPSEQRRWHGRTIEALDLRAEARDRMTSAPFAPSRRRGAVAALPGGQELLRHPGE